MEHRIQNFSARGHMQIICNQAPNVAVSLRKLFEQCSVLAGDEEFLTIVRGLVEQAGKLWPSCWVKVKPLELRQILDVEVFAKSFKCFDRSRSYEAKRTPLQIQLSSFYLMLEQHDAALERREDFGDRYANRQAHVFYRQLLAYLANEVGEQITKKIEAEKRGGKEIPSPNIGRPVSSPRIEPQPPPPVARRVIVAPVPPLKSSERLTFMEREQLILGLRQAIARRSSVERCERLKAARHLRGLR